MNNKQGVYVYFKREIHREIYSMNTQFYGFAEHINQKMTGFHALDLEGMHADLAVLFDFIEDLYSSLSHILNHREDTN